ncbi:transcription termination/antitermination protein NusA [Clostridia bacterium]|nr:transcription termination/antitermination protein NusA [Clostridia bacterium]
MNKEFIAALDELEREKNIPKKQILDAVSKALVAAYKGRSKQNEADVYVEIDEKDGTIDVLHRRTVVEEVMNEDTEVSLAEMREFDDSYEIGDVADFPFPVEDFSRIAAQTAKQVVVQAIRDAERGMIYDEYKDRQGEIITGLIQRVGGGSVYVTIGRTEGVLPVNEQVRGERYAGGNRMKFYIVEVRGAENRGPQIFLSRTHPNLVRKLFELEVPEIREGIVSIVNAAREPGSRTKMAVQSADDSVDPVGACVGSRGNRVQAVVDELMDEKIDIIPWSNDLNTNIKSALQPATVEKIVFDEEENRATAVVPDFQLSLAIGKEGQNVRLAARLCGVKIDIKSHSQYYGAAEELLDLDMPGAELDAEGFYNVEDFMSDEEEEGTAEAAADAASVSQAEEAPADEEEYLSPDDYDSAADELPIKKSPEEEEAEEGADKDADEEDVIEES